MQSTRRSANIDYPGFKAGAIEKFGGRVAYSRSMNCAIVRHTCAEPRSACERVNKLGKVASTING